MFDYFYKQRLKANMKAVYSDWFNALLSLIHSDSKHIIKLF
ncbi:hypothetical protein PTRA_b0182 [Pseudoalteromonas translucida KMM 520]|uniref:Uncharacterized protein n=1 Tax=Pseudoalteromonas translucida KMM 520 TaxID=1315283 RepID=A0A0U2XBQ1_9GAMM|nr:hypothetical protein PTRA_b0182 [Pseudoalteromonas translucida KMM 520]